MTDSPIVQMADCDTHKMAHGKSSLVMGCFETGIPIIRKKTVMDGSETEPVGYRDTQSRGNVNDMAASS